MHFKWKKLINFKKKFHKWSSISCVKCGSNNDKIFKEESVKILKILGVTDNINE